MKNVITKAACVDDGLAIKSDYFYTIIAGNSMCDCKTYCMEEAKKSGKIAKSAQINMLDQCECTMTCKGKQIGMK